LFSTDSRAAIVAAGVFPASWTPFVFRTRFALPDQSASAIFDGVWFSL
jgi:hypothetical protein